MCKVCHDKLLVWCHDKLLHDQHQLPEREAIADICFGTLEQLTEEIFKIQSPPYQANLTLPGNPSSNLVTLMSVTLTPVPATSTGLQRAIRDSSPNTEGRVAIGPRSTSQSTLLPDRQVICPHQRGVDSPELPPEGANEEQLKA